MLRKLISSKCLFFKYQSTDEKGMLKAADCAGFSYCGVMDGDRQTHLVRRTELATRKGRAGTPIGDLQFQIDGVINFNSFRRRMTVLVRNAEGNCFVITKGADDVMFSAEVRLSPHFAHLFELPACVMIACLLLR